MTDAAPAPTVGTIPVRPITPAEAQERQYMTIPDFVIQAFNALIGAKLADREARFSQAAAVDEICAQPDFQTRAHTRDEVFKRHWLNVEKLFTAAGWSVDYDKPGFNEPGDAWFTFTARRRS